MDELLARTRALLRRTVRDDAAGDGGHLRDRAGRAMSVGGGAAGWGGPGLPVDGTTGDSIGDAVASPILDRIASREHQNRQLDTVLAKAPARTQTAATKILIGRDADIRTHSPGGRSGGGSED